MRPFPLAAAIALCSAVPAFALAADAGPLMDDGLIAAEQDAANRAQNDGQWTALRAAMAEGAIMFLPQAASAEAWLADRKQDPDAAPLWSPQQGLLSCDGRIGVTTGQWRTINGAATGRFSTVWERQQPGSGSYSWRWVMDHGFEKAEPAADTVTPEIRRASCEGTAQAATARPLAPPMQRGEASSPDGTLRWSWAVDDKGGRVISVALWNGTKFDEVIRDEVAPEG